MPAANAQRVSDDLKVSVIVPVYNPGQYLQRCVDSILGQSLPSAEYEAIFVDDGSTDDSPARLDDLAAAHPNVRVIHQPNSGWPGKPRNVGIDAARGKYVYFVDHDDALAPEALERLFAFAEVNRSDIVIGKVAGRGRGAPRKLFLRTRGSVTLDDAPLMSSLAPHKLYRRAFLNDHGIRFPEGRRRMEDMVFVAETYFAANVISILADYTCYYHLARHDRANAARGTYDPAGRFDPAWYYRFLREVLDVIETHTEPGPARDRLLRRFAQRELLVRFTSERFLLTLPARRRELFEEVRSVVERYLAPSVDAGLPAHVRAKMALVRANRLDLLVRLAEWDVATYPSARSSGARQLDGGGILINVEAELVNDGRPLRFERRGDKTLLPVPAEVAKAVPVEARLVPALSPGDVLVVLRRRADSAETLLRPVVERRPAVPDRRGFVRLDHDVKVEIDPSMPAEGSTLGSGRWAVMIRMSVAGFKFDAPVLRSAGFGRSAALVLEDGALVFGKPRWRVRPAFERRRLPSWVWAAAATKAGQRVLARLGLPQGR